jgi:uncharacterized OB-fold protein
MSDEPMKREVPINRDFFTMRGDTLTLVGSRCSRCNKVFFPRKRFCTLCLKDDQMKVVNLSDKGKVVSFTVAYQSMLGIKTPYAFGYVDLQDGVRIFGIYTGFDPEEVKLETGRPVRVIIEPIRKDEFGQILLGYKFRPE